MKPLWRQLFDSVEQNAAPLMQDATASPAFADFMKVAAKITNDVNRQGEAMTRQWLHMWNLPAAGDVSSLKKKIGSLENEVRSLQRMVEENQRLQRETLEVAQAAFVDEIDLEIDDNDADEAPVDLQVAS